MLNMTEPITDEWTGCYKEGWKGMICDEAFQHPAKFSRALIRQIYDHVIAEGWARVGDLVVDPFGGVALGGFDAMRCGLNWYGCELEAKFHGLGNQNIALWNERYSRMPNWGSAVLLNGDSRKLVSVIRAAMAMAVSSPPYVGSINQNDQANDHAARAERKAAAGVDMTRSHNRGGPNSVLNRDQVYGSEENQLGAMKEGDLQASLVVSSPPYIEPPGHGGGKGMIKQEKAISEPQYGKSAGQISELPEGDLNLAISSPPYNPPMSQDHNGSNGSKGGTRGTQPSEKGAFVKYGNTDGQLEGMSMEGHAIAVSSPPYPQPYTSGGGINQKSYGDGSDKVSDRTYQGRGGDRAEGNLETLASEGFQAAISSPPFEDSLDRGVVNAQSRREYARAHGVSNTEHISPIDMDSDRLQDYGETPGQLGKMKGGFDAAVTSPPFLDQGRNDHRPQGGMKSDIPHRKKGNDGSPPGLSHFGESEGQVGTMSTETFWSASRTILEQLYQVLTPGAHAVFVVKAFVRNKAMVDFPGQWAQLCEAVGFVWLHDHHALLTEEYGTQNRLDGGSDLKTVARKSFFRRLAEKNGSPKIDFENVLCFIKPVTSATGDRNVGA